MDKQTVGHRTIVNYSVIKRNDLSSYERSWRNLKCTLRRERSQSKTATHGIITTAHHYGKGKTKQ